MYGQGNGWLVHKGELNLMMILGWELEFSAVYTIIRFFMCVQDGKVYALLLHQLAPESCNLEALDIEDPVERAKAILAQAERINCKKYISVKDLIEGSPNLNLAFVAHLFHTRYECCIHGLKFCSIGYLVAR